jgi:transportin-1
VSDSARGLAGLLLKNKLRASIGCLDEPQVRELFAVIQEPLIQLLQNQNKSQSPFVKRTIGSILSTLVTDCNGLVLWPNLLLDLLKVNSDCALRVIERICEDAAFELIEYPEMFANFCGAIFTSFDGSESTSWTKIVLLSIIGHLIPTQSSLLTGNVSGLLQCMFKSDPRNEVSEYKVTCCRVSAIVLEFYWTFLSRAEVCFVFERIVGYTENCGDDSDLIRECSEFWLLQVQMEAATELIPMIPTALLVKLIPLLMDRCVFDDEDDEEELCSALEDLSVPDEEESIINSHRRTTNTNSEEEESTDDSLIISSIRKCSAATLDAFSLLLLPPQSEFLSIFLSAFNDRVGSQDWKQREAALLAFGAISENLLRELSVHLPQVVPFVLANAESHPHPLVRSMSLWTLSRVSTWLLQGEESELEGDGSGSECISANHRDLKIKCWRVLIESLGDANKRVQLSAGTALCKFIENTPRGALEESNSLVSAIFLAMKCYQRRNMLIIYDLIRALASLDNYAISPDSETFQYWRSICACLIDRIDAESVSDSSLFPIVEALMALLPCDLQGNLVDEGKRNELVFKALTLAAQNLSSLQDEQCTAETIFAEGLDDFLVAALDLLAAAMEGSHILPSVQLNPLLSSLLAASLKFKESSNVRQSAFALFGDLVVNNFSPSQELQGAFSSSVMDSLLPTSLSTAVNSSAVSSVNVSLGAATNAVWALGEFALRFPAEVPRPALPVLLSILLDRPVLEVGFRIYFENVAVCIGRLLLSTEEVMMKVGCSSALIKRIFNLLSTVECSGERSSALSGYVRAFTFNISSIKAEDYKFILLKINELVDFDAADSGLLSHLERFRSPFLDNSEFYNLNLHPTLKHLFFHHQ